MDEMKEKNGWEIGINWIAVALFVFPLIGAVFIAKDKDYEKLKIERNALIAEMSQAQIRRAYADLNEYYDAKAMADDFDR